MSTHRRRIRYSGMILFLLWLLNSTYSVVFAASITEPQFWAKLRDSVTLLQSAIDINTTAATRMAANQIIGLWNDIDAVQLDNAQAEGLPVQVSIDMAWLTVPLRTLPNLDSLRQLRDRAQAMLDYRERMGGLRRNGKLELDNLQKLLQEGRFRYGEPPVEDTGNGSEGEPSRSPSLNIPIISPEIAQLIVIGGAILLVTLVLIYVARLLNTRRVDLTADVLPDDPVTAQEAQSKAAHAEGNRDYRMAIRYMYLECLLALDEARLLEFDRTMTNREYLAAVKHQPALLAELTPVVDTFEHVWYGFATVDEGMYQDFRRHVERLRGMRR